jgi:hypothetical protein
LLDAAAHEHGILICAAAGDCLRHSDRSNSLFEFFCLLSFLNDGHDALRCVAVDAKEGTVGHILLILDIFSKGLLFRHKT